jgi:hypothetical protein
LKDSEEPLELKLLGVLDLDDVAADDSSPWAVVLGVPAFLDISSGPRISCAGIESLENSGRRPGRDS